MSTQTVRSVAAAGTSVDNGGITVGRARDEARGTGMGERLGRHQRDLVRDLGVGTMRGSFDPVVARNALLHLARRGARSSDYVPDVYGGFQRGHDGALPHYGVAHRAHAARRAPTSAPDTP